MDLSLAVVHCEAGRLVGRTRCIVIVRAICLWVDPKPSQPSTLDRPAHLILVVLLVVLVDLGPLLFIA